MNTIEITEDEGAIIFREHDEEFFIPEATTEHANRVRSAIAFFLYATQQQSWIEEFNSHMEQIVEVGREKKVEKEKKKKRSHLKVVK
jgi:hypothetical protein|tara:strand:+ start:1362 stop:1622 length:261 start_codon:yes stop_codon:yes gene_type:complete